LQANQYFNGDYSAPDRSSPNQIIQKSIELWSVPALGSGDWFIMLYYPNPLFSDIPEKTASYWCSGKGFQGPDGLKYRAKTAQTKGLWKPIVELQICRILENMAIIGLNLHTNRKEGIIRFFRKWPGWEKGKWSPYMAYSLLDLHTFF
jgi:hypothetical protein